MHIDAFKHEKATSREVIAPCRIRSTCEAALGPTRGESAVLALLLVPLRRLASNARLGVRPRPLARPTIPQPHCMPQTGRNTVAACLRICTTLAAHTSPTVKVAGNMPPTSSHLQATERTRPAHRTEPTNPKTHNASACVNFKSTSRSRDRGGLLPASSSDPSAATLSVGMTAERGRRPMRKALWAWHERLPIPLALPANANALPSLAVHACASASVRPPLPESTDTHNKPSAPSGTRGEAGSTTWSSPHR